MITVGEILYTNVHPFFYHLNRGKLEHQVSFIPSIPAKLNDAMAKGEIDVGAISSFSYAKNHEQYVLMPNLAVSAKGEVRSIFLFSKKPIEELNGCNVALTHSSATSINLLKLLLKRFYKHENVRYETVPPVFGDMMASFDACLLIGDDAIEAKRHHGDSFYVYDLAERWTAFTDWPMTFAVFAMRKEKLLDEPNGMHELYTEWKESRHKNEKDHYAELAKTVTNDYGGTERFWQQYFTNLRYHFLEEDQRGLLYFYQLLHEEGFLDQKIDHLNVWDIKTGIHSIT
ncbi:menaquinone biosynthesis protein [Geomicrobium sediminis]|uniref:Chorismate dehydratase n=1 Tax=Geomicrobium sediminis TaxID=1347788 RepID=A0ABS2PDN9_9BACL|nr:menaquinone biosynthesis protein [Geomicrobium sediminis]MBM7633532.1 chorismate dehydratase [Geomicrobium sediminis]